MYRISFGDDEKGPHDGVATQGHQDGQHQGQTSTAVGGTINCIENHILMVPVYNIYCIIYLKEYM